MEEQSINSTRGRLERPLTWVSEGQEDVGSDTGGGWGAGEGGHLFRSLSETLLLFSVVQCSLYLG